VKDLLEGGPVGGISNDEKYIASRLNDSGAEVGFIINNDTLDIHQRYWADHAKYCIIDNKTLIITSENWAKTGIPTNPTFGNRGWGVIIRNKSITKYFQDIFFDDFNTSKKDIYLFNASHEKYGCPPDWFEEAYTPAKWSYTPIFNNITVNGSFNVSPVLAPDTSLLLDSSVIKMIDNAKTCVYVEQLECKKNWTYYGKYHENLYLESAINAARRGVTVRILFDSRYNWTNKDNWYCVQYINNIASSKELDLKAKMAKLESFDKIHNKGIIVDNSSVFVGSLNWNYNAVTNNRETGVIIENKTIAKYFAEVFISDWNVKNETHFTFSLKNGWNFITMPLKNSTYKDAESLGSAIPYCTSVATWDANLQVFDRYDVGTGIGNFSITRGRGYFIYVANNTNFTITGDRISSVNITIKSGWNSVGWFNPIPTSQGNVIHSIGENAGNCSVTAYWNNTLSRFVIHPKSTGISRFDAGIGGYFIYIDADGYWNHS
jgi:phosphatidylserine/phosphatidylglycerophosphate/cardiolipin synthase-like enzyme